MGNFEKTEQRFMEQRRQQSIEAAAKEEARKEALRLASGEGGPRSKKGRKVLPKMADVGAEDDVKHESPEQKFLRRLAGEDFVPAAEKTVLLRIADNYEEWKRKHALSSERKRAQELAQHEQEILEQIAREAASSSELGKEPN